MAGARSLVDAEIQTGYNMPGAILIRTLGEPRFREESVGVKKNRDFDYRKAAADLDGAGAHDPEEIYACRSEKAIRSCMSEHGLKADKYFKQDKRDPGAKKDDEGCFFTTACVEARGLPGHLSGQPPRRQRGDRGILPHGPGIVDAINAREDRGAIWNRVYAELVEPCVALICDHQEESAYRLYREYALMLRARYGRN